jgi:7-carboxy-7-deazaguanine synthase
MFGNNPILPPKKSDGNKLDVQEIFTTFQGEGIYTGFPAIFLRLGGCNLACKFCDTEFDSFTKMDLDKIIEKIANLSQNQGKRTHNLVVITGGEPLRQNIKPLCEKLLENAFAIQIETNGTLFQDLPAEVDIVCSPKNSSGKYYPIRPDLLPKISAFKFLISASDPLYNFIPQIGQENSQAAIYLQAIDEQDETKNNKNRELTLKLASENGCRISLQTHKFWGID